MEPELQITLNGVRNLPLPNTDMVDFPLDPNREYAITLICSPTGVEMKNSDGDDSPKTVYKLRASLIETIALIDQNG